MVWPYLSQYLFKCQSTQSVSSVLTGGRYDIFYPAMSSSLDWFVMGYCIAHSRATCLWEVSVSGDHWVEMLTKGLKYTLDNEEKERVVSLATRQNSTPPSREGGRIVSLYIVPASDIMHTLSPYTRHLTKLTFKSMPPAGSTESLFEGIFTNNPFLKDLEVLSVQSQELLALVNHLPKVRNLASLALAIDLVHCENAKSYSLTPHPILPLFDRTSLGGYRHKSRNA